MNKAKETPLEEDASNQVEISPQDEDTAAQEGEINDPPEGNSDTEIPAADSSKPEEEKCTSPEGELQKSIELMEASLAQSGSPDFKTFWAARKKCLELFKENISPAIRAIHWVKYRELTKEARRLKDIFEEQTAFAVEQIDIAIKALEKDVSETDRQLEKIPPPEFPKSCRTLKENLSCYSRIQCELKLLNTWAARINGLRKELIKTEIRIRQKNKFFQRLSVAGDHVFPRRKKLIKEVSELFIQDVDAFVKDNFSGSELGKSLYSFREEIKDLQAVAKLLTLNTHAFSHARMKLSECWDKLKAEDKERKKVQGQQKENYKKNAETVQAKINELNESLQRGDVSIKEAQQQLEELSKFMRTLELGREELSALRGALSNAQKPIKEKLKEDEKKRRELILEKEQTRQKKIKDIEEQIESLRNTLTSAELTTLTESFQGIRQELNQLELSGFEKESLQRLLVPIKDVIAEKEEEKLLKIPDDAKAALKQLKGVLHSKQQRRIEIKDQIEKYRKACGSSGLDFEQSMYFNEQLNVEKTRLENINQDIEQVESKISGLSKS